MNTASLVAAARLANTNRSTTLRLYQAQSLLLKDRVMFDSLKSLIAEAKSEVSSFISSQIGVVKELETDVSDLITFVKTAKGTAAQDLTEIEKSISDITAPISAVVTAATTAGSNVVTVASTVVGDIKAVVDTAAAAGTSAPVVAGPGVVAGTTVTAADPVASTITISTPTVANHTGDGSETLVVTPAATTAN